jgi:small-conductance mechanosensitive channel
MTEQTQTRITYKRVKNLGNHETEALEVSTTIADDADVDVAIALLREKVLAHLNLLEDQEETDSAFMEGVSF